MLLQDRKLYFITDIIDDEAGSSLIKLRINPGCEVFNGHFPGYPVVPGVCSMETVRECAETVLGRKTFMRNIIQCRFRNIIEPSKIGELTVKAEFNDIENGKRVNAVLFENETVYMELKAELVYVA